MTNASEQNWLPKTIISGGQTGVDRAALDWASQLGIPHGGWCPKGRLALDGPLPSRYQLRETASEGYRQRTKLNVQDSDATLIFNIGLLEGGTRQTVRFAQTLGRPYRIIQLDAFQLQDAVEEVQTWLKQCGCSTLNIAGPSEVRRPGIYARVLQVLAACTEPT